MTDRLLYRLTILSLSILCVSLAWRYYSNQPPPNYRVGQRVDDLPEIDFRRAPRTIVLWLNTRCEPCYESIPLFRRIIERSRRTPIVAVSADPLPAVQEFVAEIGLKVNQIVSVGERPVKLWGTPTILVVDERGVVRDLYVGLVQKLEEEHRILAAVN